MLNLNNLFKKLSFFKIKEIIYVYLIYILLVSLISFFYIEYVNLKYNLSDQNGNIIFKNLQFDNSELIENLYNKFDYSLTRNGITYHLEKLPLFPLLLLSIISISKSVYFIIIFKNLLLFSIYFFVVFYFIPKKKNFFFFISLLCPLIFIPYNFHVGSSIFFEDSLVLILLPLSFLICISNNKKKFIFLSILLFFLYFSKTYVFLFVLIFPFIIIIIDRPKFISSFLLIFSVFCAVMIWGVFGKYKTGKFPFGSSLLSVNSQVLSETVFNKYFLNYYPDKSVDLIINELDKKKFSFKSEWEFYEYYNKKNQLFLKDNLFIYFKGVFHKILFIFFNFYSDGLSPKPDGTFEKNQLRFSHFVNKIIFNISILLCIYRIIKNLSKKNYYINLKIDIYFFFFCFLNLIPLLYGWATQKHLVPIQIVSYYYLFFVIDFYKNKLLR